MKGFTRETPSRGVWRRWPSTTDGSNAIHTVRASKARVLALRFRAPNGRRGRRWARVESGAAAVVGDDEIVGRGRNHVVEEETVRGAGEWTGEGMIVGDLGGTIAEVERVS